MSADFAKLVLMLSSDQDGEVAAAARAIDRRLKAEGRDWHWLADVVAKALRKDDVSPLDELLASMTKGWGRESAQTSNPSSLDWRDAVEAALDQFDALRPREVAFMHSLLRWRGQPTDRQMAWADAIFARLGIEAEW